MSILSFDKSLLAIFALLSIIVTAFLCFKTNYPLFKLYKVSSLGLTLSIGLVVIYFLKKSSTISLGIFDYLILAFFGVDLIILVAHPLSLNSIIATALSLLLALYYLLAKHIFLTKESIGILNLTSFAASVFLSVVTVSDYISHGYNYYLTMGFFTNSGFNAILIAVTGAGGMIWFARNFYDMSLGERTVAVLSVLVIVSAIVISQSRTALMSLLGVIILEVFLFYRARLSCRILTAFLIMSLVGLCVVGYFLVNVKRPSAEGRFFLWSLSTSMIIENPLTGVGLDNFQYAFNEAQADYFKENPESIFLNRAGDISNPFNDYIYIAAERGIFSGFQIIVIIAGAVYLSYRSRASIASSLLVLSLCALGSYSFSYSGLKVLFVTYWAISSLQIPAKHREVKINTFIPGVVFAVAFSISFLTYRSWIYAHELVFRNSEAANAEYRHLYPVLQFDKDFHFEYGADLISMGKIDEGITQLQQATKYNNSPDLFLMLGEGYDVQGRFKLSQYYYREAAAIRPGHLQTLYLLMDSFSRQQKTGSANLMAKRILSTEHLERNKVTRQILTAARNQLSTYKNQQK